MIKASPRRLSSNLGQRPQSIRSSKSVSLRAAPCGVDVCVPLADEGGGGSLALLPGHAGLNGAGVSVRRQTKRNRIWD